MFLLKILIWLASYFIFYILFSLNTLISIFCFILIIFIISLILLQIQVEYLTFLIMLLYLGGILIFFLFTALMLNNEYHSNKTNTPLSVDNIIFLIFFFKCFFLLSCLNFNLCYFRSLFFNNYLSVFIENNYFLSDILKNQGDVLTLMSLYTEKSILLFILGFILLFTMMAIIVITRK